MWEDFFAPRFFKYWKRTLTNLKIPGTVFLLLAFSNIKKHTSESRNTWHSFFLIAFWNIEKSILTILKVRGTVFFLITFSNIKKKHTCKISDTIFSLITFLNIKKGYFRICKYLAHFFCSSLFQILKKDTYESENTWNSFFAPGFFKY